MLLPQRGLGLRTRPARCCITPSSSVSLKHRRLDTRRVAAGAQTVQTTASGTTVEEAHSSPDVPPSPAADDLSATTAVSSAEEEAAAAATSAAATEAAARAMLARLSAEVDRRRNFAIISHPDAGKTTLTEKLLLYGGAINEAGEVKARRAAKSATSDWMELEKQRGISITSTALSFEYLGCCLNLLDTPGHQDFSEDTYRTLAAADNAVLLVDGAKGIEAQTRKLFEVARLRKLPVFTFVNKMDRPALNGFEIVEQLEKEFGLTSYPVNWPIGSGDRFCGLYHRPTQKVVMFPRRAVGERFGVAKQVEYDLTDPILDSLIDADLLEQVREDVELLEVLGEELDVAGVLAGRVTPMFFGSAQTNFGVELFLRYFIGAAALPSDYATRAPSGGAPSTSGSGGAADAFASLAGGGAAGGGTVSPRSLQFTGLVFKLQANMDPRHRDKVAFVRVCSGMFEKGMKVRVARTGRMVTLAAPQKMFADTRVTVQEGFAGDVIGLTNPGAFAIGDTLHTGPAVAFPPIPTFSPELFSYMRCAPNQKKPFAKGIEGLLGEGAVQVLYSRDEYVTDPILAAVGALQYEVVSYRMKEEYGVDTTLEPLPYTIARWVMGGWAAVDRVGRLFNTLAVRDGYGRPVLLFRNEFALTQVLAEHKDKLGELSPYSVPPEF